MDGRLRCTRKSSQSRGGPSKGRVRGPSDAAVWRKPLQGAGHSGEIRDLGGSTDCPQQFSAACGADVSSELFQCCHTPADTSPGWFRGSHEERIDLRRCPATGGHGTSQSNAPLMNVCRSGPATCRKLKFRSLARLRDADFLRPPHRVASEPCYERFSWPDHRDLMSLRLYAVSKESF
mmetsp:Transcript_35754/g.83385  ORF Transcript_35754/g.83385 Transcript_35754/m.83385 type:complete len:178 (+) Transcript_35754:127-660(+)